MVKKLAQHTSVPVINGLTDIFQTCQALVDLLTVLKVKGTLAEMKLAYVSDGNNVAHSHAIAAARKGFEYNPNLLVKVESILH